MIKDLMNEVGVVSRVLSVMTITNIAWFVAILGLTATIVPFVIVIFMAIHFWRVRKDGGISGPL